MYKGIRILALIPARGGSKQLPRKNIRTLCSRPLIAWTIEQARASRYIDRVIVSTDDKKIADISRRFRAEVPYLRPKTLATDKAKMIDVIIHALKEIKKRKEPCGLIMLLQPTSPLRLASDIDKAVELFFLKKAGAVVSVCEADYSPYWENTLSSDMRMKNFLHPCVRNKNRQDLPKLYKLNGAIYLSSPDYLIKHKGFFGERTFAYLMPQERSVDIDNEIDFKLAEVLIRKNCLRRIAMRPNPNERARR